MASRTSLPAVTKLSGRHRQRDCRHGGGTRLSLLPLLWIHCATLAPASGCPQRSTTVVQRFPSTDVEVELELAGALGVVKANTSTRGTLSAGQNVTALRIKLHGDFKFGAISSPRLKLVPSDLSIAQARAGGCASSAGFAVGLSHVSAPLGNPEGAEVTADACHIELRMRIEALGLRFLMGGSYRLCYSDDGTFAAAHADIVPVFIDVLGVHSGCTSAGCLGERKYRCYSGLGSHSVGADACVVGWNDQNEGAVGAQGKVSWTPLWPAHWRSGTLVNYSMNALVCGTAAAPDDTVFFAASLGAVPDSASATATLPLRRPLPLPTSAGYVVAACYCPAAAAGRCASSEEFVQQIGLVYVYVTKLCRASEAPAACAESAGYAGVAPLRPFAVLVHCPPGPDACPGTDESRIRLVDEGNPIRWASDAERCQSSAQTSLQIAPSNCESSAGSDGFACNLSGGSRQDWKHFGGASFGFLLRGAGSEYEARGFLRPKALFVCFCITSCSMPTSWFPVGRVMLSPYRLANLQSRQAHTVGVPGMLGLQLPAPDAGAQLGLEVPATVKLLQDPGQNLSDADCQTKDFDEDLVPALTAQTAATTYQGRIGSVGNASVVIFDGGDATRTLTFARAGFVAVCYCGRAGCGLQPATGTSDGNFHLALRLAIRGPLGGQKWTFSTGLPVRLTYSGFGLSAGQTLRVIAPGGSCLDRAGDPVSSPSVEVGCPDACERGTKMNIATEVLAHNKVACNLANKECRTVYARSVRVLNATTTEVVFGASPGLRVGDRIVLGNVACGARCTSQQLVALRDPFATEADASAGVGTLMTGMVGSRVLLGVGWEHPVPEFVVPELRGTWSRTNEAQTAEELRSTEPTDELKVCWAYAGQATYVQEMGTIRFVRPPKPAALSLHLITREAGRLAPVIISFKTGDLAGYDGDQIRDASGELRLRFPKINVGDASVRPLLEPRLSNSASVQASLPLLKQDELAFSFCGFLFLELWAPDSAGGFPLPRGCRFRRDGDSVQLHIAFEPGAGLRRDSTYQVVLNAVASEALRDHPSQAILELFSIADGLRRPYEALEAGTANLHTKDVPIASSGRLLAENGGAEILGGSNGVLELDSRGTLDLHLRLHPAADAIALAVERREMVARLVLSPLTQWNLRPLDDRRPCSVTCIPNGLEQNCESLADCTLESIVSEGDQSQRLSNVIKFSLPAGFGGERALDLRVKGVSLQPGGFFPVRPGLEVSMAQASGLHYVVASGDFIWKQPSATSSVAELVAHAGDGNSRPFRGDFGNVLHIHLALGASLRGGWSAGRSKAGSLSIQLPNGYKGIGAIETPGDLGGFALLPSGRRGGGTLEPTRWVCDGSSCTYALKVGELLPAGAEFFVSLVVNNPPQALPASDEANAWYLELAGSGDHTTPQRAAPVRFRAVEAVSAFVAAVPVLGRLRSASLQPTHFAASSPGGATKQDLLVFFGTEQSTSASGRSRIRLDAPSGFDFGATCAAEALDAAYYSGAPVGRPERLWRLPSLWRCVGEVATASEPRQLRGEGVLYNRALLTLNAPLRSGRQYGFSINVVNADHFDLAQLTEWRLWTQTEAGVDVDGSGVLELTPGNDNDGTSPIAPVAWGLYKHGLRTTGTLASLHAAVSIDDMRPFRLTGAEATVTFFPLRSVENCTATLRITAPSGYEWRISSSTFAYRRPSSASDADSTDAEQTATRLQEVPGATADLPGGLPSQNGNVLTWPMASYAASETYGFVAQVRIPDRPPVGANAFLIEFGHAAASLDGPGPTRVAAGRLQAPPVRVLRSPGVSYSTNVQGEASRIRFAIELVTDIPEGGGLVILVPDGFKFAESCTPQQIDGEELASTFPRTKLSCQFLPALGDSRAQLRLQVPAAGGPLKATTEGQAYRFELPAMNPPQASPLLPDASASCGWSACWTFQSFEVLPDFGGSASLRRVTAPSSASFAGTVETLVVGEAEVATAAVELDARCSVPGFPIVKPMLQAQLEPLLELAPALRRRDDRPQRSNMLTFSFTLRRGMEDTGSFLVRAPAGFVFEEDCLTNDGVNIALLSLFRTPGIGNETGQASKEDRPWWASAWEPGLVHITSCEGSGHVAELQITAGLRAEKRYAFAIKVLANPDATPTYNKWLLEAPGESSRPFDGFAIHALSDASVRLLSTAASPSGDAATDGAGEVSNVISVSFRTFQRVSPGGLLVLTAPPNFSFVYGTVDCPVRLQGESAAPLAAQCESSSSPDEQRELAGTRHGRQLLRLRLAENDAMPPEGVPLETSPIADDTSSVTSASLEAGHRYHFSFGIQNPSRRGAPDEPPPLWHLESFAANGDALDAVSIVGEVITRKFLTWNYVSQGPAMEVGRSPVFGLRFQVSLPDPVVLGDTFHVRAPSGYLLDETVAAAKMNDGSAAASCGVVEASTAGRSAPAFEVKCFGNQLVATYQDASEWPAGVNFEVVLNTANPARNPPRTDRLWVAEHWDAGKVVRRSSAAMESWKVVPSLEKASVELLWPPVGENVALDPFSATLELRFAAATAATSLWLEAKEPAGFDFSGASVSSRSQAILFANHSAVRIKADIREGEDVVVQLEGVRLPGRGGWTSFSLATFASEGVLADRQAVVLGFRQPWTFRVTSDPMLAGRFDLEAAPQRLKFAWPVQMGTKAVAKFTIQPQSSLASGQVLRIRSNVYVFDRTSTFALRNLKTGQRVALLSTPALVGEGGEGRETLQARLGDGAALEAGDTYELQVACLVPTLPSAALRSARWSIEALDDNPLPAAHVDISVGKHFHVVASFALSVRASRSPPLAQIELDVSADLRSARPSLLRLIAPLGFAFPEECLAAQDSDGGIASCTRGNSTWEQRSMALLTMSDKGLSRGSIRGLRIRALAPEATPSSRQWLLEGLDVVSGKQVGWGEDGLGFAVVPMQDVFATYAPLAGIRSQMALRFRTSAALEATGTIQVDHPEEYNLSCDERAFKPMSLPGITKCVAGRNSMTLVLSGPLQPGEYTFIVGAVMPAVTPAQNFFALVLRDRMGFIRDSAMGIPGLPVLTSIRASAGALQWTSAQAGQASLVTLGFHVEEELAAGLVGAVLISLPENFRHTVGDQAGSSSIASVGNATLARPNQVPWVDAHSEDRILLRCDTTRSIPAGSYRFNFPVTVPIRMPAFNVWQITLCVGKQAASPNGAGCQSPEGPDALVTFPVAGFDLGQPPSSAREAYPQEEDGVAAQGRSFATGTPSPASLSSLLSLLLFFSWW